MRRRVGDEAGTRAPCSNLMTPVRGMKIDSSHGSQCRFARLLHVSSNSRYMAGTQLVQHSLVESSGILNLVIVEIQAVLVSATLALGCHEPCVVDECVRWKEELQGREALQASREQEYEG